MPRNSPTISMVRTSASESFGAGPRWRMRRPLSRWSIRQKTATMKVLRSIRRRPPLCVRCYWANTERKEVFSLAQLFTRNLHMGLANSWETSRRAIRPCTASSVLCGLAVSISRALCSAAIRWLSSMRPPCVQFLDAFRLTLPKIHKQHTAGEGMMKSRGPRGRNPATTCFANVSVLAILLDPVALIVLLVFVLHGAPGYAMGAILLSVLILCRVEGLLVDLLGSLGQVVLDIIR